MIDPTAPLDIAAVDDHPFVLEGIRMALARLAPWVTMRVTASSVSELLQNGKFHADVVLMDLDLGSEAVKADADPAVNVQRIRDTGAQVVLLTAETRPVPIRRSIAAGAVGLMLKADPPEQLIHTLQRARRGELALSSRLAQTLVTDPLLIARLSPREHQVFELLAQGVGRNEIGKLLDPPSATSTVDTYIKKVAARYRQIGRETFNAYETLQHLVSDGHLDLPRRQLN